MADALALLGDLFIGRYCGGMGDRDVFFHISAVERARLTTLNKGQQIEYEEVANKGKTSAENLKMKQ